MGLFDKLFGKKQPEAETKETSNPQETVKPQETAKPQKGVLSATYLEEIQKITDRLEEIQKEMTEENKAQYQGEIKALLQREVEILEGQFPGKDG